MLRPYQTEIIDAARGHMRQGVKNVLIELPTGGGKTILTAEMFKGCLQRQKPADFMVHRKELIEQTAKTFHRLGMPFGIVAAGEHCGEGELIQLCSVQTVVRRITDHRKPFMRAWDECHHIGAGQYQTIYSEGAGCFNIGLSATPILPNGDGLGDYFQVMVNGKSVRWLIDHGYLSDYKYFAPIIPDLDAVKVLAGEYNPQQVDQIMRGKAIVGDIVQQWFKYAAGKLTIGFAASRACSMAYVEAFQAAGIAAAHIDATTPKEQRKAICHAFARREILVLFNVGLFEEGFDLASYADMNVTIECMIGARPTKSLRLIKQINGRTLRPKPEPAVILDVSGNFLRHGLPDDPVKFTLEKRDRKAGNGGTSVAVRQCPMCYAVHRPAEICPECKFVYPVKYRTPAEIEGELQEIKRSEELREEDLKRRLQMEVNAARTLPQLMEIQKRRGYRNGWAVMKFKSRR